MLSIIRFSRHLLAAALFCISLQGASAQGNDWYNLDYSTDSVAGISVNRALAWLESKAELSPVIVAVIDDGVDINHPDFAGRIWVNPSEKPGDGLDNDGNGYVDDVHGWNYLGNPDGENIEHENLEITRMLRDMAPLFDGKSRDDFKGKDKKAFDTYTAMRAQYDEQVNDLQEQFTQFSQLTAMYSGALAYARERIGREDITINQLLEYETTGDDEKQVFDFLLMAEQSGMKNYIEEGADYFDAALNYHYNFDFQPRSIVNTDASTAYGNNMVDAANPDHGTHVAGIIAALRGNDLGVNGIAPNAVIMPLRTVPAGDERDEDIAKAIRYAVDNGARIINMSFGKGFSPNEPLVHEAMRYAESKDVLLIHAAGNDASNNDRVPNYPDGTMGKRKAMSNWITVGASGPNPKEDLLAEFSNYGKKKVDILAPGVDINSLKPGEATAVNSGTSMAAPVVSGLAALILGIDPSLSAKEVKAIILRTATPYPNAPVTYDDGEVKLKKVLRNPGVVNAYEAVKYTFEKKD